MKYNCVLVVVMAGLTCSNLAGSEEGQRPRRERPAGGAEAKVEYYQSAMDGKKRPYGVCATDDSDRPKPLIIQLQPGLSESVDSLSRGFQQIEKVVDIARKHGLECVAMRPTGRGPGSLFQNYGEVDAWEAIEDACSKHAIDRDRITLFGHSMGGAAVFYMVSHYPDKFAGAAPMSGYCDYRLWQKPGGYSFHMPPWEEPSWRSRSAALLADNFQSTPMWIMHGAWDRGVGSGVSVEHSRQMHQRLTEAGYSSKYTEVPQSGHQFLTEELFESGILWLLEQQKQGSPPHVRFSIGSLRHNTSDWVTIGQFERYGEIASVDARLADDGRVVVKPENVRTFSLGPIPGRSQAVVEIAGQALTDIDLSQPQTFRASDGEHWEQTHADFLGQKHHGCSGPIGDLFFEDVMLVSGSTGTEEENYFTRMAAYNMRNLFRKTNGGLHRGGIPGENSVELPYVVETDLSDQETQDKNLLLFGTPETNGLLKRFAEQLPLKFGEGSITLGEQEYRGDQVSVFAIFPHPNNKDRYVAVHGGVTPDATTFGSHLNVLLLPDYLVYNGADVLDWGFFDNQWQPVSHAAGNLSPTSRHTP